MNESLLSIIGAIQNCPVCTRRLGKFTRNEGEVRLFCFEDGHGVFIIRNVDGEWIIEYQLVED